MRKPNRFVPFNLSGRLWVCTRQSPILRIATKTRGLSEAVLANITSRLEQQRMKPFVVKHPRKIVLAPYMRGSEHVVKQTIGRRLSSSSKTIEVLNGSIRVRAGAASVTASHRNTMRMRVWDWMTVLYATHFLPRGYPESVHVNYSRYVKYTMAQVFSNTITKNLSTHAMLVSMNIMSPGTALFSSAVASWFIKDGVGAVGSVVAGRFLNSRLDQDPKRYRFVSVFLGNISNILSLLVLPYPPLFLALASAASIFSKVGSMLHTSCRPKIYASFGNQSNLADLMRASSSQAALATTLGTMVSVPLSQFFGHDSASLMAVFAGSAVLTQYFSFRSCSTVVLGEFNLQRYEIFVRGLLESEEGSEWTPTEVSDREVFVAAYNPAIIINPPLNDLARYASYGLSITVDEICQVLTATKYCVSGRVVFLAESASDEEVLFALYLGMKASVGCKGRSKLNQITSTQLFESVLRAGWSTDTTHLTETINQIAVSS